MENITNVETLKKMLTVTYLHEARLIKALEPEYMGTEKYDAHKVADLQTDAIAIKLRIEELTT